MFIHVTKKTDLHVLLLQEFKSQRRQEGKSCQLVKKDESVVFHTNALNVTINHAKLKVYIHIYTVYLHEIIRICLS